MIEPTYPKYKGSILQISEDLEARFLLCIIFVKRRLAKFRKILKDIAT